MHDANGTPLKVGDRVIIPAVVKRVSPGADFCNVTVETTLGRKPDGHKETMSAINTAQVVKVSGDETKLDL